MRFHKKARPLIQFKGRAYFSRRQIPYSYRTVDVIEGVKVLVGIGVKHSLPEEAHSGSAYIKQKPDGTFHEMRIYDKDRYLVKEIAYHPEPALNGGNRRDNVLHIHEYKRDNFKDRSPRLPTAEEIKQFKKYLKGVELQ